MSKEQLIQALAEAFERLMTTATEASQRGITHREDKWGPREVVAHLAGREIMASERIPKIAAGMSPLEETDEARQAVMTDAINATIIAMIGDQSLDTLCGILRLAYQCDIAILRGLDEKVFQPGKYVFERTKGVIEHCQEHSEELLN